jgi:hypothetical protein
VFRLLHQVNQTQRVLRQQQTICVERNQIIGPWNREVRFATRDFAEKMPVWTLGLLPAPAHQPDIGIQVHGLVWFVRQVDVLLSLEHRKADVE